MTNGRHLVRGCPRKVATIIRASTRQPRTFEVRSIPGGEMNQES